LSIKTILNGIEEIKDYMEFEYGLVSEEFDISTSDGYILTLSYSGDEEEYFVIISDSDMGIYLNDVLVENVLVNIDENSFDDYSVFSL